MKEVYIVAAAEDIVGRVLNACYISLLAFYSWMPAGELEGKGVSTYQHSCSRHLDSSI
jgi:hypothetical protein